MEFTEKLYNISDQETSGWERRELFLDFVLCSVPGLQCNKAVQTSFAKAPASKYRNFSIAGIGLASGANWRCCTFRAAKDSWRQAKDSILVLHEKIKNHILARKMSMTASLELLLLNGVYVQYDGLFNGLKYWLCHIYTCHNTVELLLSANYEMYFVSNDSVLDAILPKFRHAAPIPKPVPKWSHEFQ